MIADDGVKRRQVRVSLPVVVNRHVAFNRVKITHGDEKARERHGRSWVCGHGIDFLQGRTILRDVAAIVCPDDE